LGLFLWESCEGFSFWWDRLKFFLREGRLNVFRKNLVENFYGWVRLNFFEPGMVGIYVFMRTDSAR